MIIRAGFAVTATENILMMAAFRKGKTTIELAAIEPHVMNLVEFLRSIGTLIEVGYDHKMVINGSINVQKEAEYTVIGDYIEAGTFIIL